LEDHAGRRDSRIQQVTLLNEVLARPDFALTAYEDGLLLFQRGATDTNVS